MFKYTESAMKYPNKGSYFCNQTTKRPNAKKKGPWRPEKHSYTHCRLPKTKKRKWHGCAQSNYRPKLPTKMPLEISLCSEREKNGSLQCKGDRLAFRKR